MEELTTAKFLLTAGLLLVGIIILFVILALTSEQDFRRFLKPGDRVTVYEGTDRYQATVKRVYEHYVKVIDDNAGEWFVDILLIHKPND